MEGVDGDPLVRPSRAGHVVGRPPARDRTTLQIGQRLLEARVRARPCHRKHPQRMQPVVDGAITVTLDQTRDAMRLIAEKTRTIAEGAGALALAAALTGQAGEAPFVCIVSGGNIDLRKFAELVTA